MLNECFIKANTNSSDINIYNNLCNMISFERPFNNDLKWLIVQKTLLENGTSL